jgi:hypothetical protein
MGSLRREVMVPVPTYRRPSSLIGMSIVLVLLASAVDAVVWSYQAKRAIERESASEITGIPTLSQTDVAAVRARALEADLARAEEELRQVDEQMLERLRADAQVADDVDPLDGQGPLEDVAATDRRCDAADPLCTGE